MDKKAQEFWSGDFEGVEGLQGTSWVDIFRGKGCTNGRKAGKASGFVFRVEESP